MLNNSLMRKSAAEREYFSVKRAGFYMVSIADYVHPEYLIYLKKK